ncbi:pirin family protein [Rhodovulum sp. DZ06]|uniref:pirin family protein n=1 Tax=Rhodovulum sp. DZ06 TaxID=3425126 RepID=UPI003D34E5A3
MTAQTRRQIQQADAAVAAIRHGEQMARGAGFEALSFTHRRLDGLMDPLLMVDHFTMTAPTFPPHAHAGLSAVSVLFEDSVGGFRNRDSLGNDVVLAPGDLYWLTAARGAVHDEAPTPGSRTHALQLFVNLPAARKLDAPAALHVPAARMPVIEGPGHRVRVMTGRSGGVVGAAPPAPDFTILDIALEAGGGFAHALAPGAAAWLHAIRGAAEVEIDGARHELTGAAALAVHGARKVRLRSDGGGQVALLSGAPLREAFVQKGPFAMRDEAQLAAVTAAHAAGALGALD